MIYKESKNVSIFVLINSNNMILINIIDNIINHKMMYLCTFVTEMDVYYEL